MRSHAPCSLWLSRCSNCCAAQDAADSLLRTTEALATLGMRVGGLRMIGAALPDLVSFIAYLTAGIRDDSHFGIYFRSCVVARNK